MAEPQAVTTSAGPATGAPTFVFSTRLSARDARQSQVTPAVPEWELGTPADTLRGWQEQLVRPQTGWLRVDALLPPQEVLRLTLDHLVAVSPGGGT